MDARQYRYDPADLEMTIGTRPDKLRFFTVAGLKRGREYELMGIVSRMHAEDVGKAEEEPKSGPPCAHDDCCVAKACMHPRNCLGGFPLRRGSDPGD